MTRSLQAWRRGANRASVAVASAASVVMTLLPAVARADAAADARELFVRGRALRTTGDCDGALPLFRRALALYPAGLGSLRNIAECEERLGRFASARRAWLDLEQSLGAGSGSKYEGWAWDAEQATERLGPKVATLTIEVAGSTNAGVDVTVNDERLAPSLIGTPVEHDPGSYVVRLSGARTTGEREERVDLAEGQARRLVLTAVWAPDAPVRDRVPPRGTATRVAGWTAVGVGAAALVGAGVSWAVRQSSLGAIADRGCTSDPGGNFACTGLSPDVQADIMETRDRGNTAATLATVLTIAGCLGVAGGVALLATDPSGSAGRAALVVSPAGAWAIGRF